MVVQNCSIHSLSRNCLAHHCLLQSSCSLAVIPHDRVRPQTVYGQINFKQAHHETPARIKQETMQEEAMLTHYICTVKREASLKALFMVKDDELTFQKATELAQETEEASDKSFKETVHEPSASSTTIVLKMYPHAE